MVQILTKPGGIMTFNNHDGFIEAIVRGYRLGFLTDVEYRSILQCESLDDVKLNLQPTDYGSFLQGVSELTPSIFREKATEKMVNEFKYLRMESVEPLSTFLDYITYDYMIDNVMLILKATLNNPDVNLAVLIQQAHPMGMFDDSVLKRVAAFKNSASGYTELYNSVLVETPIGKYFKQFLDSLGDIKGSGEEVKKTMEEMPTTKLEYGLRKLYLEDFADFCEECGGETAEQMLELIKARADATTINITLNSFGTILNNQATRVQERSTLCPSMGYLYPEGTRLLVKVGDENELSSILRSYPAYKDIFDSHQRGDKTIDDAFYERETQLNELAFEGQSNYCVFYSWVRLKEQEIRNLVWICECIVQRQKDRTSDHFVPIFSRDSAFRVVK